MATSLGTEKISRNKELYADFKSGEFSLVDLVSKYRISAAAIYKIVKRLKERQEKKKDKQNEL